MFQPRSQGLSSKRLGRASELAPGVKMRDPGNEVANVLGSFSEFCYKF